MIQYALNPPALLYQRTDTHWEHPMKLSFLSCCIILVFTLSQALAAEQSTASTPKAGKDQQYGSVEERRIMESIQPGGTSSAREQEELENRKKELKRLEGEVDKKIEQLNQLRVRIEKLLEQKNAEEEKRVTELAKVYEKMTADKAATVLGTLDQELAIALLAKMKTKSAAKILNNMERDKAAKLSTGFSTLETP